MRRPRRRITIDTSMTRRVVYFLLAVWILGVFFLGWLDLMVEDPGFFWTTVVMSVAAVVASWFS